MLEVSQRLQTMYWARFALSLLLLWSVLYYAEANFYDLLRNNSRVRRAYNKFVDGVYVELGANYTLDISKSCGRVTRFFNSRVEGKHSHALKVLRASGKPGEDVLSRHVIFLGSYSTCVNSRISVKIQGLSGKHCLVEIAQADSEKVTFQSSVFPVRNVKRNPSFGLCIPSTCNENDVQLAVSRSWTTYLHNDDDPQVFACYEKPSLWKDPLGLCTIILLVVYLSLVLYATWRDAILSKLNVEEDQHSCDHYVISSFNKFPQCSHTFYERCLLCFSLKRNSANLFSFSRSNTERKDIPVIHGIRVLATCYGLSIHSTMIALTDFFLRSYEETVIFLTPSILRVYVSISAPMIDVFFFFSGLLVIYTNVNGTKTKREFSKAQYFTHRIIRLFPMSFGVVILCAGFGKYLAPAPDWSFSYFMHNEWCRKNWWLTFTYFQNFFFTKNECYFHSLYAAADFQCYILALSVLILLRKNIKWAFTLMVGFFISSSVITFTTARNVLPMAYNATLFHSGAMEKYLTEIYFKPYCHIGPFLIGMLAGYIFTQKQYLHLKKAHVVLLWCYAVVTFVFVIFGSPIAHDYGVFANALYNTLARTAWALFLFSVTLICNYGYGGFINDLLSWKGFYFLSRLSYSVCLIHVPMMWILYAGKETSLDYSFRNVVIAIVCNLVISHLAAVVAVLVIELPFLSLEAVYRTRNLKHL